MPQIAQNITVLAADVVDGPIIGNGKYHLFISESIATNNNKAIDAVLSFAEMVPNRDGLGGARFSLVMERLDDAGNWRPIHSLYSPVEAIAYSATRNGGIIPDQQISYGPIVFNFDGAVSIDASDGENIISQDHQKRGVMPAKFRLCAIVHEKKFGDTGAFQSATFSIDYELRAE